MSQLRRKSDQILQQHSELMLTVERLRVVAQWQIDLFSEERIRRFIERDLATLVEALDRHFTLEESGEYLEMVVKRHPHWRSRVEALRDQHEGLAQSFEELLQSSGNGNLRELQKRVLTAIDALITHERSENDLINDSFRTSG